MSGANVRKALAHLYQADESPQDRLGGSVVNTSDDTAGHAGNDASQVLTWVRSVRKEWTTQRDDFNKSHRAEINIPYCEAGRGTICVEVEKAAHQSLAHWDSASVFDLETYCRTEDKNADSRPVTSNIMQEPLALPVDLTGLSRTSETTPSASSTGASRVKDNRVYQTPPAPQANDFAAAWVTPGFQWPRVCDALLDAIPEQFQTFAEEICRQSAAGRRVIGFATLESGQGGTTLLLALARRLSVEGVPIALVDADFSRGQLAESLGVCPHFGWHDVIEGRAQLTDALIESTEDRLTVLPTAVCSHSLLDKVTPSVGMQLLRRQFPCVLVDLGAAPHDRDELARWLRRRSWLDGALLIQDERSPAAFSGDWYAVWQERKIALLGVANNFAPLQSTIAAAAA